MDEWTIRPHSASDIQGILGLVNLVQPRMPYTPERWSWQYPCCPGGPGQAWVADLAGRIVALTGALPFDWYIDGRKTTALLWVDTMTHPDFRHRGLHAKVTGMALEAFHESGSRMAYVFPNEKSTRQLMNMDWKRIMEVPRLVRAVQTACESTGAQSVAVQKTGRFGPEIDVLCERLREVFRFALVRSQAYLNWRYLKKPDDNYLTWLASRAGKRVGYMVCKLYEKPPEPRRLHIVDLWTEPEDVDAIVALLRHAIILASEADAEELSCWMLPHAPSHPILLEHGFVSEQVDRHLFGYAGPHGSELNGIEEPGNWYITMGDSDVY